MNYHLAIDIGASSGRHILGYIEDSKIKLEENLPYIYNADIRRKFPSTINVTLSPLVTPRT